MDNRAILEQGIRVVCVLGFITLPTLSPALTDEEERTLNRLQEQAEIAIGQGDPDGAALTIGKAALLASQIARKGSENEPDRDAQLLASLYRTQEHAYRAIALFRQSGSQAPASFGVCQTLAQGFAQSAQSQQLTLKPSSTRPSNPAIHRHIVEWEEMLQELKDEFGCAR